MVAAILYLMLTPHPPKPENLPMFEGADKVVHACMMGGLMLTAVFDRVRAGMSRTAAGIAATALWVMAFGVYSELLQGALTANRTADILDVAADWAGTLLAATGAWQIIQKKYPEPTRRA